MDNFTKILQIVDNETVELSQSFKERMHKELSLGMTRYACRYGSLSDGHEKITPAQRYYQAIREMWTRSNALIDLKADAMEAQADLIDCEEQYDRAHSKADKLRAEAKRIRVLNRLKNALVSAEDTNRQLDEFNKVRKELEHEVTTQYPEGIEQAERDSWEAVAMYRIGIENATRQPQHLRHVPLDPETKAKIGIAYNKPELSMWSAVSSPQLFNKLVEDTKLKLEKK